MQHIDWCDSRAGVKSQKQCEVDKNKCTSLVPDQKLSKSLSGTQSHTWQVMHLKAQVNRLDLMETKHKSLT